MLEVPFQISPRAFALASRSTDNTLSLELRPDVRNLLHCPVPQQGLP